MTPLQKRVPEKATQCQHGQCLGFGGLVPRATSSRFNSIPSHSRMAGSLRHYRRRRTAPDTNTGYYYLRWKAGHRHPLQRKKPARGYGTRPAHEEHKARCTKHNKATGSPGDETIQDDKAGCICASDGGAYRGHHPRVHWYPGSLHDRVVSPPQLTLAYCPRTTIIAKSTPARSNSIPKTVERMTITARESTHRQLTSSCNLKLGGVLQRSRPTASSR